jgi:dimethylargininase
MGYFCDSESGRLRRVALAAPTFYRQTEPINRRQEREALGPPVDRGRLLDEHLGLREALIGAGVEVVDVEPHPQMPYLLNIRDPVVVIGAELVQFQMGERLREAEPEWVVAQLGGRSTGHEGQKGDPGPAGTLEGGDVFQLGGALLVGVSQRTTPDGAADQLGHLGRAIHPVRLAPGVLHLDTVFNTVGGLAVLGEGGFDDVEGLGRLLDTLGVGESISVGPEEVDGFATNFLCLSDRHVLITDACPTLRATLSARGIDSSPVAMREHHRIGGSVRCATLVLEREPIAS